MQIVNGVPTLEEADPAYRMKEYSEALAPGSWTKVNTSGAWSDYVGGGGYRNGFWYRREMGGLRISGMVKGGSANSEIVNLNLNSVELRPGYSRLFPVSTSGGFAEVQYDAATAGHRIVYRSGPAAPTYVSIDFFIPYS
ncbi:hypothetical protein [Arthrobacter woluwensis]|uniref:hypothetical protein n=1 Tax=Arthrobacter woluwensis TaxID=156980 RepID=UPI001AAFE682|nr:hypothetical protein [Arthrobacter woluwensis]QTF71767.1 hypothetical protein G8758_06940 [Arthrobacter woluwensis]